MLHPTPRCLPGRRPAIRRHALLRKLRVLLSTYAQAGGRQPVVLFHDGEHGAEMIDALARYGDGLPANVLPVQFNEITQAGLEAVAGAFAYGASAVRFLTTSSSGAPGRRTRPATPTA